ncbi:MAG: adenosylcobinamide-GDP ribazoletransferase [Pseudomonadota bacterium]
MNRELVSFALALQFLTRLPIDVGQHYSPELFARSVRFYPLAGAVIGTLGALIYVLCSTVFPHAVAVVCSLVGLLLITGAFHEDGLADCFDGLGGGADRATKLHIMRDSRLGTYGTLALISTLALRASVLISFPESLVAWALILGHSLSRLSAVFVIHGSSYARDEGTGKPVAHALDGASFSFAIASGGILLLLGTIAAGLPALVSATLGLVLGHVVLRRWIEGQLGGYTGDTLGAIQQVSELGFLLGWLAWL